MWTIRMICKVMFVSFLLRSLVCGFQVSTPGTGRFPMVGRTVSGDSSTTTVLRAGFGGAVASKKKKSTKNQKLTGATPFDASASLVRMEKVYDELSQNEAKRIHRNDNDDNSDAGADEVVTAEYVITTRCSPFISDWVPIAQIILARPLREAEASEGSADPLLRAAVSQFCREISHVAGMGSRVFQSIPRSDLQYAVESVESFHKHVYEVVMEGKNENTENEQVMTKAEARKVLGIEHDEVELSEIKKTYRKLSMEYHPDRFVGESNDAKELASAQYARIKLAYDTLQSGIRNGKRSWYESLGGRSRTDFSLIPDLLSIEEAGQVLQAKQTKAAICGLDPTLVQTFVARSQSAAAR